MTHETPKSPKRMEEEKRHKFETSLRAALSHYEINRKHIDLPKNELVSYANDLLMHQETSRKFRHESDNKVRLLFALAVANALHSENSQRERRALVRIQKLVSWRYDVFKEIGSYSGKVLRASKEGYRVGTRFDPYPKNQSETTVFEDIFQNLKHAEQYKDHKKSELLDISMKKWGVGTLLHEVRQKMGIRNLEEVDFNDDSIEDQDEHKYEYPVMVVVTSLPLDRFSPEFNCAGTCITYDGTKYIVLPADFSDHTFKHEYVHAQTDNDTQVGLYGLLFQALNEIMVELIAGEPFRYTYSDLDPVWKVLSKKAPNLEQLLFALAATPASSKSDDRRRDDVNRYLIKNFGLLGFLDIARLRSSGNSKGAIKTIHSSITLTPDEVLKRLNV